MKEMKKVMLFCLCFLVSDICHSQIEQLKDEVNRLEQEILELKSKIEVAQLQETIKLIKSTGLPSQDIITHKAMVLSYNEAHEQANWVAHMILPEIKDGRVFRSNDFREDPMIHTGTANQTDYFLTDTLQDGTVEYDGFGYDRGHLAPSADFRWSAAALSESYFYSNMSPQLPEFNQECWAKLEAHLRGFVIEKQIPLVVITVPLLQDDLPKVDRAVNNLSIPSAYGKVVYDPTNQQMIAFHLKHQANNAPLDEYAMSVDQFESIYKMDVFKAVDQSLEQNFDKAYWFTNLQGGDVEAIPFKNLPKGHYNTVTAVNQLGNHISICGEVVGSRYSRKGHLWLNLDRQFPNQVFSIFIKKEDLVNFPYDLKTYVDHGKFCFRGEVKKFSDVPHINIKHEGELRKFEFK